MLADVARALTEAEWQTRIPKDGRKVGVVVHHVASVYPLEIHLAQALAGGQPVTGVTVDDVNAMNAAHAIEYDAVTKEAALELLRRNSAVAAAAIRALSDEELEQAAPASLVLRRPAHVPVHARGPRRPPQLSPPRAHPRGVEALARSSSPERIRVHDERSAGVHSVQVQGSTSVKGRQQAMWASGDFAVIGTTLQIVGELLCEAVDLQAGERVLDVAAGNGNATLAAARRFAAVTSTDYVPALLERGRRRAEAEGFDVAFEVADAEDLPYPDASFDVVVSTVRRDVRSRPPAGRERDDARVSQGRTHRPGLLDPDRIPGAALSGWWPVTCPDPRGPLSTPVGHGGATSSTFSWARQRRPYLSPFRLPLSVA